MHADLLPDEQKWDLRGGSATLSFDLETLAARGLRVIPGQQGEPASADAVFVIAAASTLTFSAHEDSLRSVLGGQLLLVGDLTIATPHGAFTLTDLVITPPSGKAFEGPWRALPAGQSRGLVLGRIKAGIDPASGMLTVRCPEVSISKALAALMGDPSLADVVLGSLTIHARADRIAGPEPEAPPSAADEAITIDDPPVGEAGGSHPACGPGAGACNEANGTPGCDHVECCNIVCDLDPFCCDVEWDEFCAGPNENFPGASCAESCNDPGFPCAVSGGDMTFCQLYGLYMPYGAREGDVAGLGVATTSWNIGTEDLIWLNIPDEEHPFIVMNLFRLMDDRLEQIGQSHIKHGFYALGSHQCGGPPCTFEPGHYAGNWLGTGCTDTYGAALNAAQSGMGPKYEVNPWTGYWYYPGSHMQGSHSHDHIEHRIQVLDDDLDAALNPGATYYVEGYYVMLDDIDVMNSAAWKPVTVSGSPGGSWSFSMGGSGVYPNIGFGIDVWAGAQRTTLAQELPIIEFQSPDGRSVLASKVTGLGGGIYHYEYALYNVDMDRQVGSFSIPVPPGATITNIGFHGARHHGEPFNCADPDAVAIDNAVWQSEVAGGAISWSTSTNPIRWGTMYNFRFDADVPPAHATATVGLFRTGSPTVVTGETMGPLVACQGNPDCNGDGTVGPADLAILLANWGPCVCCVADINEDGTVGPLDLAMLLANWG